MRDAQEALPAIGVCQRGPGMVPSSVDEGTRSRGAPGSLQHTRSAMATDHHHKEESNLKEGVIGVAIALVGLVIIMAIAHFMALAE